MTYWRIQLLSRDPATALQKAVQCLAAGYIGLDAGRERDGAVKEFHLLVNEMRAGDPLLVISRHFSIY